MNNVPEKIIKINRISPKGESISLLPETSEFPQINAHLPYEKLNSVRAKFKIVPWGADGMRLTGTIEASGEQICVVTNETLETEAHSEIDRTFLASGSGRKIRTDIVDGEMIIDPEAEDPPDILESDTLNLWEVIFEELNLAIDPYPRKIGASIDNQDNQEVAPDEQTHKPFAALQLMINEKKSDR